MKTLLLLFVFALLFVNLSYSQEIQLPPAIDNEYFTLSVGDWVSDEYEFMGMKWTDETTVNWILNNQFLEMKSVSTSDQGFKYEAVSYMTVDNEGNIKAWMFDLFGMQNVSEYTGKTDSSTCTMEGGNEYMKSTGTVSIEDNVTTQSMTFTYPDKEGNTITQEMTIISRKK